MANHAYVSFWTRDRAPKGLLARFGRFLETFPLSSIHPGFAGLTIRAVSPAEPLLAEHDLRGSMAAALDVIALAREYDNVDCCYEVQANWDLWQRNLETGAWQKGPEQILLTCNGALYDDGVAETSGDFLADIGFEHFFTGHGGLLGGYTTRSAPSDPVEAE